MLLTTVVTNNQDLKNFINEYLFKDCKVTTSGNGIGTIVIPEFEDSTFNTALNYFIERCATHSECKGKMELVSEKVSEYSQLVSGVEGSR